MNRSRLLKLQDPEIGIGKLPVVLTTSPPCRADRAGEDHEECERRPPNPSVCKYDGHGLNPGGAGGRVTQACGAAALSAFRFCDSLQPAKATPRIGINIADGFGTDPPQILTQVL